MSLYLKYRPTSFEEMIGNQDTVATLQAMLEKDPPHVLLFYGPTGCGKTTLARIFAGKLGCQDQDLKEINTADFRGIDTIREIRQQSQFKPMVSACRVWIIDEAHKLTNEAQNAMLKLLEDTPPHVYFALCTTDPDKLLPTVRGRCCQLKVSPLSERQMKRLLHRVARAEHQKLTKDIYEQIHESSEGRPREALQILEQVLNAEPERRMEIAKRSAIAQAQTIELCRALLGGVGWKKVANILKGLKEEDPESVRRAVLGYCSAILLKEENDMAARVMEEFLEPFYNTGHAGLVFACYSVVKG